MASFSPPRPGTLITPVERALAEAVQAAKSELLTLLREDERRTVRRRRKDGRAYPQTFEDAAQRVAASARDARQEIVRAALKRYQDAINALWSRLHLDGTPEYLYSVWASQERELARQFPRIEVEAEIIFIMRDLIAHFNPSHGIAFRRYAPKSLRRALRLWAGTQRSVVRRPELSIRRVNGHVAQDAELPDDEEQDLHRWVDLLEVLEV